MIAAFVTDRMASYIAGGMNPETAAYFARSELEAIYGGNHYSRDDSGAMRLTLPPEAQEITHNKGHIEGHRGAQTGQGIETQGTAPETAPQARETRPAPTLKRTGLEGLKNYVKKDTA